MAFWKGVRDFFLGTPEIRENVSTLRPEQEPLYNQAVNAGLAPGAGGAFGTAADYYRNNLSDNPADFQSFAAPEMRRFNQDIIPGLSEQFAGMGSGGLSSSGFRNAAVNAGTDLSERLGAIRANLRQSSAQGLMNIGQQGLANYSQNMVTQPGSEGFLSQVSPIAGQIAAMYAGSQMAAPNSFGGKPTNMVAKNTNPYGGTYNGQYGNGILNQQRGR